MGAVGSRTEMATLKWPSISERRSSTETATNHIDLVRSGIPNNGSIKLTIQIPRNWTTQSRATSLGTEMATLKWPSIAERRSPTETTSSHIDLDRSGIPNNGSIKLGAFPFSCCLLYTSPSPRDRQKSRMPSSA